MPLAIKASSFAVQQGRLGIEFPWKQQVGIGIKISLCAAGQKFLFLCHCLHDPQGWRSGNVRIIKLCRVAAANNEL